MRRIRFFSIAIFATLALTSIPGTSAFGAAHAVKLAEAGNVLIQGSNATAKTELQNAAGSLIGEGESLSAELESETAGKGSIDLTNVRRGTEPCLSPGDPLGTVLWTVTYQLVNDLAAGSGVARLVIVSATILCGTVEIKVSGSFLTLLLPVGGGEKTTGFTGVLLCSGTLTGEPKEVSYWDATGTKQTALLQANFGGGAKKACINVSPNLALTATKMIELVQ
jgi:hypothetical protein